ncbi:hypothetical protein [Sphingomonas sp. J315]|uniref:hypothetical protein n=1 Tax=Sphingomonas sp. J315 TaxID=2898433 RepID=UPI0021AD89C7|nr:hypothetical protein [Sphingomonas sp. J315]UUY01526.1 hypothetical protein LRS08_10075 [Sphingomonas sp. J315]
MPPIPRRLIPCAVGCAERRIGAAELRHPGDIAQCIFEPSRRAVGQPVAVDLDRRQSRLARRRVEPAPDYYYLLRGGGEGQGKE